MLCARIDPPEMHCKGVHWISAFRLFLHVRLRLSWCTGLSLALLSSVSICVGLYMFTQYTCFSLFTCSLVALPFLSTCLAAYLLVSPPGCLYTYLSAWLPINLFTLFACLFVCLHNAYLPFFLSVYTCMLACPLATYIFAFLSTYLTVHLPVCLLFRMFVCLPSSPSVCLSVPPNPILL